MKLDRNSFPPNNLSPKRELPLERRIPRKTRFLVKSNCGRVVNEHGRTGCPVRTGKQGRWMSRPLHLRRTRSISSRAREQKRASSRKKNRWRTLTRCAAERERLQNAKSGIRQRQVLRSQKADILRGWSAMNDKRRVSVRTGHEVGAKTRDRSRKSAMGAHKRWSAHKIDHCSITLHDAELPPGLPSLYLSSKAGCTTGYPENKRGGSCWPYRKPPTTWPIFFRSMDGF